MSDKVTIEEQERMGLRRPRQELVRPEPQTPARVQRMTPEESAALQSVMQPAYHQEAGQMPALPQATHTAHMRDNFDVRANARVAERWIVWDMAIYGGITLVLVWVTYYLMGGDKSLYAAGGFIVWGTISYVAMHRNRAQAYDHSPTGVARLEQRTQAAMHDRTAQVEEHRIDMQAKVAMYAIDAHVGLMERRQRVETKDHERLTD